MAIIIRFPLIDYKRSGSTLINYANETRNSIPSNRIVVSELSDPICPLYTTFTPAFHWYPATLSPLSLLPAWQTQCTKSLCSQVHWNSMIFLLHERKGSLFHFPWLFPSQHTALNYQQRKNAGFHKCTWERTPSARIRGNQIALELYEWTDVWNYGMAQHMNLNYSMHISICCVS